MRVLVVGAGAIGGLVAARMALAGHDVTAVARGAHLEAMQRGGLVLEDGSGHADRVRIAACGEVAEAGPAELVVVALKAHQIPPVAAALGAAIDRAEAVVPIQNGISWWFFQRLGGPHEGRAVEAVDPGGLIRDRIDPAKVLPCFAVKSAEVVAPGVVRHIVTSADAFPIGELDGQETPRLRQIVATLAAAGIPAAPARIRDAVWMKLLGNIWANPISALTRGTVGDILGHPETRRLCLELMGETLAVAHAHGGRPSADFEARLAGAAKRGGARPSMLQDRERGRPMELSAILGALIELGTLAGVPTPRTATLHACLRLIEARDGMR